MTGESLPTVGKILGHTQAQTTARYAHLADDPLQSASDRVASSLKKAQRNLSTTLRHRRFLFTDSFLLLWKWRVG